VTIFIYNFLKYGHLIGMSILIGTFALNASPLKKNLRKTLFLASFLSLLTGIAMVGLSETHLAGVNPDFPHSKIALKLILTLAMIWLWAREKKSTESSIKIVGIFSLGITALALFWT